MADREMAPAPSEDPPPDGDKGQQQTPDDEDDEHIVERDPTGRYGRVSPLSRILFLVPGVARLAEASSIAAV